MFAIFNPHLNWILCWFWLKQIDGDIEDREQYDNNANHDYSWQNENGGNLIDPVCGKVRAIRSSEDLFQHELLFEVQIKHVIIH